MKKQVISDWEYFEKLVSFIEKTISPRSKIEHNVSLDDLSRDSDKRQCDVIIRTGEPPRETITLVEVQNRSRGFNITFFDGLIEKMRKVGAQHLIVVSRKSFPKSIINEAKRLGNTIRLVYFDDDAIMEPDLPRFTDDCIILKTKNIIRVNNVSIRVNKGHLQKINRKDKSSTQDRVFIIGGKVLSINDIVNTHCLSDLNYDVHQVKFIFDSTLLNDEIYLLDSITEEKHSIKLNISADVEIENIKLPINYITYSQVGYSNSLAIVMYASGIWRGNESYITAVMKKMNDIYHMTIYDKSENLKNSNIEVYEIEKI
ncbi:hypothetical protein SAMN05920897_1377 [Alkalispirochaeta americana]|uniref:Restriction endonuclease n=1 Tax=Alkalispirochaeta americana TaxID=159291 RepID=A0A1N6Y2N7_9SPIO|nr:hypothetical protein SAMN05920897_1377 [Alkalispirochaeta americana]